MIKIAVVEDSAEYTNLLRKKLLETNFKDEIAMDAYLDPIDFVEALDKGTEYLLCFLDIKMPRMDGVRVAEEIRKKDSRMLIVFLSSYLEYATEGYRVRAFDYLLKERLDDKWDTLADRIIKQFEDDRKKVYKIVMKNRVEMIPLNRIIYVYKEGKYCIFVVEGREKDITIRKAIKEVEKELENYKNFIHIKRGYIINVDKIQRYTAEKVIMENGDKLTIGRLYVAKAKELVMRYVEEL